MMKNLLLAFRTLKNYRLYTVINIVGLSLSLACVITLSRYIYSELSVDHCHRQFKNIYGVVRQNANQTNSVNPSAAININDAPNFRDITSESEIVHRALVVCVEDGIIQLTGNKQKFDAPLIAADSNFTRIFDFPTSIGTLDEVTHSVDKAAITQALASKLFGAENPLGKSFFCKDRTYTIAAILTPTSSKTSLSFDIILPYVDFMHWNTMPEQYVTLAPGADYLEISDRYSKFVKEDDYSNQGVRYALRPLGDFYMDKSVEFWNRMHHQGDKQSLTILSIVALVVLLIGLFNFINIYTVLMLRRSREVGVKKVFGASTNSIMSGLYIENLMMITLAAIVGWILVGLCKEFTAGTLGIPIVKNHLFDITFTAAMLIAVPVLTTIFPYFKYKYAQPITSLREVNQGRGSIVSRAVFLVFQYILTIIMVIVSIYFVRQLSYMLNADPGYTSKGIISASMVDNERPSFFHSDGEYEAYKAHQTTLQQKVNLMEKTLSESPIIQGWSYAEAPNHIEPTGYQKVKRVPDGNPVSFSTAYFDQSYFQLYGLKLKYGRIWNDTLDTFTGYNCIVNETLLKETGITDYSTAELQTESRLWYSVTSGADQEAMKLNPPFKIVGVIEDFQTGHLKGKATPLIILYSKCDSPLDGSETPRLNVRATPGKESEALQLLQKIHTDLGNTEFSYTTIEEEIAAQYVEDKKITTIYSTFAIIAIFIGSLGLFSLSLYDVQQRYREIALRRVNGATIGQIISMLLRKYFILLGVAFVIAMPIAWYAIDWYMTDFAHRTSLSWWIFAIAAAITATISLLTLIIQTYKAATQNPAVAMKRE